MSRAPRPVAPSSPEVMQTLAWMRKYGFKPVPLHPASKAAINRNYTDVHYAPPSDDLWRSSDLGVGVVTGPKQSGPTDVDLDCVEAVFFARSFLPPTPAVFGRASKPASHYLYLPEADEVVKKAYVDPINKDTIAEIRGGGGHQTVMPGSIHQDTGELIQWTDVAFPEVPKVDFALLTASISRVAIASLVSRHLWHDGQRNEVCKHLAGLLYYLEWTEDDVCTLVTSVMELLGDTDRTRLPTIRNTFRRAERGGKVTGAATLRKFLGDDRVVDRILDWAGSSTVSLLSDFNERFAVVSVEGRFRVADTEVTPGEPPVFMVKEDFVNLTGTDTIEVDGKKIPKARVWLASPRRRTYRSVDFLPGAEDDGQVLNLWTGWALKPDPAGSCKAWLKLLRDVVCGGDAQLNAWMLHWFANIVREPLNKPLTAPVLIGVQGAGKSLLFSYFGRILGPAYVAVTNEEHVYGRFNRHLASSLLLHSEEALYGGEKRHRGIIKSLITDEWRIFEQKGIDAKRVRNYLRLALTSNEAHAAPVEAGDRRFTVVDMEGRKATPALIRAILDELVATGPAALFHHLTTMKYDPELVRVNVKNEALSTLKGINFTPLEAWWHDALAAGQVLPDYLSWATKPERDDWPQVVSSTALYTSLVLRLRDRGVRSVPGETLFAFQLNKFVGVKLERQKRAFTNPMADDWPQMVKLLGERQPAVLNLPPLDACRAAFEKHTGQRIGWPGDGPDDEKPPHQKF